MVLLQPEDAKDASSLPYAIDRKSGDMSLAEVTTAAIDFLTSKNDNGFFLMVEGGKIDWACHSNDAATVINEIIDMDNAVKVAYDFYQKHPDETLIVVTADHETGGFVLGKGPYTLNLKALASQKVSANGFTTIINNLRKEYNNQVSWDVVKDALKENFGFWDTIKLNDNQEQRLKKVYNKTFNGNNAEMAKSEYQKDEMIASEAKKIIDEIALTGWTSGGHSAGYTPVFAIGTGAESFQGRLNNTDIPEKIATAAGYKH
jgi:Alkaline phosphatase